MATLITDHVCKSILYKNLNSPEFKDYYTLDDINKELMNYEKMEIQPCDKNGKVLKDVRFHLNYRSFLFTLNRALEDTSDASSCQRIYRFMELSMVK
jgi:hypothetical protein